MGNKENAWGASQHTLSCFAAMRILAIESSCDETAASIVEDGIHVRSNCIASAQKVFEKSGGVIPEDAARRQLQCILPVLHQALDEAAIQSENLDAIAVTHGPGLLGSLLIGTTTARVLSRLWHLPLMGVHHTMGHLSSTWLETTLEDPPLFPLLTLSASGGHTELWLRESHTRGTLLGRTRDDAAGEAFDKGASMLGLPYPGGPAIAARALQGSPHAFPFPLPLSTKEHTLDFSFSGLKNALRLTLQTCAHPLPIADLAASFEHAICAHLIDRILRAIERFPHVREVHLVGGVSANTHLRSHLQENIPALRLRTPARLSYCTDNAAMIAAAAAFLIQEQPDTVFAPFATTASLPLEAVGSDAVQVIHSVPCRWHSRGISSSSSSS